LYSTQLFDVCLARSGRGTRMAREPPIVWQAAFSDAFRKSPQAQSPAMRVRPIDRPHGMATFDASFHEIAGRIVPRGNRKLGAREAPIPTEVLARRGVWCHSPPIAFTDPIPRQSAGRPTCRSRIGMGDPPGQRLKTTMRMSVISSTANRGPSRPMPLKRTPP